MVRASSSCRMSGRPKGLSRATCRYGRSAWLAGLRIGDRKALGSGVIAHANWRGSVDSSMFCPVGDGIYGIYDQICHPIYEVWTGAAAIDRAWSRHLNKKGTDGLRRQSPIAPLSGVVFSRVSWIALGDPLVDPCTHFLVTPRDPALTKLNPLGELPGLFEPRDVLEAVRDSERLELLFRNQQSVDLHRNTPC